MRWIGRRITWRMCACGRDSRRICRDRGQDGGRRLWCRGLDARGRDKRICWLRLCRHRHRGSIQVRLLVLRLGFPPQLRGCWKSSRPWAGRGPHLTSTHLSSQHAHQALTHTHARRLPPSLMHIVMLIHHDRVAPGAGTRVSLLSRETDWSGRRHVAPGVRPLLVLLILVRRRPMRLGRS